MYVIIYCVTALLLYTVVILLGLYVAKKESKRNIDYLLEVKEIIEEIKGYIKNKEEFIMDKGNYKNTRAPEMMPTKDITGQKEVKNTLTLSDLLNQKAEEKHYEEVINLLIDLAKKTYEEYKFLIAKSQNEKEDAHFLQLVSNWNEAPELHKKVFSKSMDYGIDMQELQLRFADKVKEGKVFDLGGDVVVITDDGTGQPPTGVSPVNSGLEGGEIAFIVTFVHKDNYEAWAAHNLPKSSGIDE